MRRLFPRSGPSLKRDEQRGEFRSVQGEKYSSGRQITTPETIAAERANVRHVLDGQKAVAPILSADKAEAQANSRGFLNDSQKLAIREVLTSEDRVHGLQGLAGTGKTTTLEAIREGAEQSGYKVEGFAPDLESRRTASGSGNRGDYTPRASSREAKTIPAPILPTGISTCSMSRALPAQSRCVRSSTN